MNLQRAFIKNVELEYDQPFRLTVLSDIHLESDGCDLSGLRRVLRERSALPNHRFVLLGDTLDLVVPTDQKRWRPGAQREEVDTPDWVNATLNFARRELLVPGARYDWVCYGNHEDEFLKRHGVDVVGWLADALGMECTPATYSGLCTYRLGFTRNGKPLRTQSYRVVWHHGKWGGKTDGMIPAQDWFGQIEGWDLALYGHNHGQFAKPVIRRRIAGASLVDHRAYLVCCGSFVNAYQNEKATHYSERAAYRTSPYANPPLITVKLVKGAGDRYYLDQKVEC